MLNPHCLICLVSMWWSTLLYWWLSTSGFCCQTVFLKILPKVVSIFDLDQGSSYEQDEVGGDGVLVSQVTKDSAAGGGDTVESIGK